MEGGTRHPPKRTSISRKQSVTSRTPGSLLSRRTIKVVDDDTPNPNNKGVDDANPPPEVAVSTYDRHRFLLHFTTPETEQRYYDFQYVDNLFVPGKTFALVWVGYVSGAFFLLTAPFSDGGAYLVESLSDPWWSCVYITTALNSILFLGLFMTALKRYRDRQLLPPHAD